MKLTIKTSKKPGKALQALIAAALIGPALIGNAQEAWKPSGPIKIVVQFPPGGGADVLARLVGQGMQERLGQTVIVENKAGASGAIASDYVYTAPADGLILLAATADAQAMYPHLKPVKFETTKFVPVAGFAKTAYVLMGRLDLPAADLKELLSLMKKQSVTYSTAGAGSSMHVFTSVFAKTAKVDNLLHVPYQGAAPALQALLGGQVDLMMVPLAIAVQHRSKLKAYGVTSGERIDAMKDVPTLSEQGLPIIAESWAGLVAPPGTPVAVTAALAKAVRETVSSPNIQKRMPEMGWTPLTGTQAEFSKYYGDEYRKWGDAIRAANIKLD